MSLTRTTEGIRLVPEVRPARPQELAPEPSATELRMALWRLLTMDNPAYREPDA